MSNRILFFIGFFALFTLWENLNSYRKRFVQIFPRYCYNWILILSYSFILKLIVPLGAVFFAQVATQHQLGLAHWFGLDFTLYNIACVIFLDFCIYWQHVFSHRWFWLWRLHVVHHSDRDLDTSTAFRFHPFEIVLSLAYKGVIILFLGASVESVLFFEIILNSAAMFNHSIIRLPKAFEKKLRYLLVTPQMHLIHHFENPRYTDTNFGFNISLWDRLFGTYSEYENISKSEFHIGIKELREENKINIINLLKMPFTYQKKEKL
jgi:sterol desaturase/sphingolipid hydroxylase (fatty acid hydroxylase superfamily)